MFRPYRSRGRGSRFGMGWSRPGPAHFKDARASNNPRQMFTRQRLVRQMLTRIETPVKAGFLLTDEIFEAVEAREVGPLMRRIDFDGVINEQNYSAALRILLKLEQAHQEVEMRKHDKMGTKVELIELPPPVVGGRPQSCLAVELSGQAGGQLIDASDLVLIKNRHDSSVKLYRIQGFKDDFIALKPSLEPIEDVPLQNADVFFVSSGSTSKACDLALTKLDMNLHMRSAIFENVQGINHHDNNNNIGVLMRELRLDADDPQDDHQDMEEPELEQEIEPKIRIVGSDLVRDPADERLNHLNPEQQQAVVGILEAKCRPKPYILFGPPGTGKTHTLVETVAQIHTRSPHSRVLFCANSNTCVDQTCEKLIETGLIATTRILRLKSGRFTNDTLDARVRIVVTTNIKSACLIEPHIQFDYVIVDEAGHAHEAESLVPISTLERDGCLVLAGDPKQLGPVVQFEQAGQLGLNNTMLERILKFGVYQRTSSNNEYDPRYITKLVKCYRCDPRTLELSNRLFYDNELECLNETPKSLMRIMRLTSPVQFFKSQSGDENQPHYTKSWKNNTEVDTCVDFVVRFLKIGLEPGQIGIMTPYREQARSLRRTLTEKLQDVGPKLDLRFPIMEEKFRMVFKDDEAEAAHRRNELRKRMRDARMNEEEIGQDEIVERVKEIYFILKKQDWMCKIDTVDSFQGDEREIIIFSSVRTDTSKRLSFLHDAKRYNVAISRAKWIQIVVGNEAVLRPSTYWAEYLLKAERELADLPLQSMYDDPHRQLRRLFR